MITIIDYNTCNVGSIQNMLKKIGFQSEISNSISKIEKSEKLILPGVGSFDKGMENIEELGLIPIIKEKVLNGTPILGICLGYQLLSKSSEEGVKSGIGLLDAHTKKFNGLSLRVPHMGWNRLIDYEKSTLFKGLTDDNRFYFVHSYYVECADPTDIAAKTDYGGTFASAVEKGNIYGTQFHPEKSHKFGMVVLKNFAEI